MKKIIKAMLTCDYNNIPVVTKINGKINKLNIPFEKIYDVLEILLISACITEMIICLCQGQNAAYQTWKDGHFARGLMYLAFVVFLLQRVRLFNWQSLVVMALYIPITIKLKNTYIESPDLIVINNSVAKIYGLLLMVLVDMVAYKRHIKFNKIRLGVFISTLLMFVLVVRNLGDLFLVAPFAVLFCIDLDETKVKKLILSVCIGWIGAMFLIMWESLVLFPVGKGRYYGCFLNIGDFGQFLTGAFIANVILMLFAYKNRKFKNPWFYISLLPMPFILYLSYLSGTRTEMMGLVFAGIALIIFGGQKNTPKRTLIKGGIVLFLLVAICGCVLVWLNWVMSWDAQKYEQVTLWVKDTFGGKNTISYWVNKLFECYLVKDPALDPDKFDAPLIWKAINRITADRVHIWSEFWKLTTFRANGAMYVQVGEDMQYSNAHNGYVQALFQYGYIPGATFILCPVIGAVVSGIQYVREHSVKLLFPLLWCTMLLGIMIGEMEGFAYPVWITMLIGMVIVVQRSTQKVE